MWNESATNVVEPDASPTFKENQMALNLCVRLRWFTYYDLDQEHHHG